MKTKLMTLMIILMFMCSGCGNWMCENLGMFCPDDPTSNPEFNTGEDIDSAVDVIKKSSDNIEEASSDIAKEANNINQAASEVQNKIPTEIKSKVDSHLKNIKESSISILKDTTKINKAAAELVSAESLLENASDKVSITEDALDDMTDERDAALKKLSKAEADRDSALHKAIRWLILASIVGAGALGVFGLMYGSKMCLTLSAVCIVVMSMAIFIEAYFVYLAIGGGVILLALLGLLIYNVVSERMKAAKAIKEIVDTVEVTQEHLSDDDRIKLFGGRGKTGIMDGLQSKSTMELIQKQKNKLSNLWIYAKANGDND
jgi:ABC-type multidrug transport system fused ATPase/permease subunit